MPENILMVTCREEFRQWLALHGNEEKECYVVLRRGRPRDNDHFWYLDAVEEALCFGWIDSTNRLIDGIRMQRFTPRRTRSNWTELNKERVRRLERLGLMTDAGRAVLPDMGFSFCPSVEEELRSAGVWERFLQFPPLYQRIRASNLASLIKTGGDAYRKALSQLIARTRAGELYGEWNDYGRLLQEEHILPVQEQAGPE